MFYKGDSPPLELASLWGMLAPTDSSPLELASLWGMLAPTDSSQEKLNTRLGKSISATGLDTIK